MGGLCALITRHYYGALSGMLSGLTIERHFTTLLIIGTAGSKCTQQYLSDFLEVDKVSMVRVLDYLVDKGMIRRSVNPVDRREHHILLTEQGKKTVRKIKAGIADLNKTAFAGFNKKEQDLLGDLLARMLNNLDDLPGNVVDIKIKKRKKV